MPSSVLPSPLLHVTSPFLLPPRVFGCVIFVHNLEPNQNKLASRFLKCIFLDYHWTQKGYRWYSLQSRKYYVSADVSFFKSTPFFSSRDHPLSFTISHQICYHPYHFRSFLNSFLSPLLYRFIRDPNRQVALHHLAPNTSSVPEAPTPTTIVSDDLFIAPRIAPRKGSRHCTTKYPILNYVSLHHASSSLHALVFFIAFYFHY